MIIVGRRIVILIYNEKKDCCGCSACVNICPVQAITMQMDEYGFLYPQIDNNLCTECGLCQKICVAQSAIEPIPEPLATFVAINKDERILSNSASGGIFGALAALTLKKKGVVFGCAFNSDMEPIHISVKNLADIEKIQGSKYVQSSIGMTYKEAKEYLNQGRTVLYTGTPCQIAGLKSYLGKDYNNLITADLICHGVPSAAFFQGYIQYLENEFNAKILDFKFRDKSEGWGLKGCVVYEKNKIEKNATILPAISYYYNYFLKGYIYRENCYECKYAGGKRQGDFTMGDYWGVGKAHPEISTEKGVSVLLVNSQKAIGLISTLYDYLDLYPSTFEKARNENAQLKYPTIKNEMRSIVLDLWRYGGYRAVADEFIRNNKKTIFKNKIKMLLPQKIKKYVSKIRVN
jgi:coenzyme F420-reducing hydrogenase beta subunit